MPCWPAIVRAKPAAAKGHYLARSRSRRPWGPGVKVDPADRPRHRRSGVGEEDCVKRAKKPSWSRSSAKSSRRAQIAVVTRYRGLTVAQIDRAPARGSRARAASIKVTKNTLARRAIANTASLAIEPMLDGPDRARLRLRGPDRRHQGRWSSMREGATRSSRSRAGVFEGELLEAKAVVALSRSCRRRTACARSCSELLQAPRARSSCGCSRARRSTRPADEVAAKTSSAPDGRPSRYPTRTAQDSTETGGTAMALSAEKMNGASSTPSRA